MSDQQAPLTPSGKVAAKCEQSSSEQCDSKQMAREAMASKAIANKATTSKAIARSDDVTTVMTPKYDRSTLGSRAFCDAKPHTVPDWGLESCLSQVDSSPSPGLQPGTPVSSPSQSWPSARDLSPSPRQSNCASPNGQQKMPKNQATRGQTGGCERCFTRTNSEPPRMLAKESDQINSEQECIENCSRLSLRAVKRVLCQSQSQCLARD